jgi:hypothetical protein
MDRRRNVLTLAIVLTMLVFDSRQSVSQESESRAAEALFEQFETVFQAKTSLLASSHTRDFVRVPFVILRGGLEALDSHESKQVLDNSSAVLVGTKNYLPPKGLGTVRSIFCYVVVFGEPIELGLERHFRQSVASAAGMPVWNWSAKISEFGENDPRPSSLYASQLGQSYLLVSNDLQELRNLAGRLIDSSSGDVTRVLAGIPEWRDLSQRTFWGYRRYRHTNVPSVDAAGMRNVTLAAEALWFYADWEHHAGVLGLRASQADDGTADQINATKTIPPFKRLAPGVWQTVVPLTFENRDPDPMFGVAWLFGFGAVI